MQNNTLIELLSENFLLHVDMLECIRRDNAKIISASKQAVLLMDIPSGIYMITAHNYTAADDLISKLPNSIELILCHDKFTFELLSKKFNFADTMICYNTAYTQKTPIQLRNSAVEIKQLTPDYKDMIIQNYSNADIIGSDYIEDRLKAKVMFGAFIGNTLCGFIGSHTEGSIGMLEVLPAYRGKGIGMTLEAAAANKALADNRYVYGQVVEDNSASLALQKKLGFELSENKVYWLMN